jgi:hypothetical protein
MEVSLFWFGFSCILLVACVYLVVGYWVDGNRSMAVGCGLITLVEITLMAFYWQQVMALAG